MRKRIITISAGIMIICSACSSQTSTIREREITQSVESMVEGIDASTDSKQKEESQIQAEDVKDQVKVEDKVLPLTIDKTELVNQDGIRITALQYETGVKAYEDSENEYDGILMEVENNTGNPIDLTLSHAYINRAQDIQGSFAIVPFTTISSSKKAKVYLVLDREGIEDVGLGKIGQLDLVFGAYNPDYSLNRYKAVELKTSEYTEEDTVFEPFGKTLYEGEHVNMKALYWEKDKKDEDYYFFLYLENKSSVPIVLYGDTLEINGSSIKQYEMCELEVGKDAIMQIHLSKEDMELNDITGFSEISFSFEIKDTNYNTIDYLSDLKLEL